MKTEYQNKIISKLKQYRIANGLTQIDISIVLDISSGQLGNIETPRAAHKYTLKQIDTLCKYYKIPITEIFLDPTDNSLSNQNIIDTLIEKIIEYEQ